MTKLNEGPPITRGLRLVCVVDRPLFIRAPEDHEYLVLFGQADLIRQVQLSAIFTYDFADYVSGGHLSARTREHLEAARQAYSIG